MKKIFVLALIALSTGVSAFAEPTTINAKTLLHVASFFKEAKNINWVSNNEFDKVSFTLGKEKIDAFYNSYGELIGTSKAMEFDKLPQKAIETITTKYKFPTYTVKACISFTMAENDTNYYVSMDADRETLVLEITEKGTVKIFNRKRK